MTAITSGTYGQATPFTGAIRRLVDALFPSRPAPAKPAHGSRRVGTFRLRSRQAEDVRALARTVAIHSPGFAAELYAAASRQERYDD